MEPCTIGSITFSNRILKSSGPGTFDREQCDLLYQRRGYGGIICKTCTLEPRLGNPVPNDIYLGENRFNCYGLPNLGYQYYESLAMHYYSQNKDCPFILSLSAHDLPELETMITRYARAVQANKAPPLVEINVSCPNTGGLRIPGYHLDDMEKILRTLAGLAGLPGMMYGLKLPPYLEKEQIMQISQLISEFEHVIAYIVCSNSIPNCLPLDMGRVVLSAVYGGMSNSANKHISISNCRQFVAWFRAMRDNPSIAVIGCGGIQDMTDVADYLSPQVGCKMVQINKDYNSLLK